MTPSGAATTAPAIDLVQPFLLEVPELRGRLVRLGPVLDTILRRHEYPRPIARLLGEFLTCAATLSSMLKYDGVFTLQTKGDGPVRLMVADVTSDGEMRGYAEVNDEVYSGIAKEEAVTQPVASLLGSGYLAFTVDQGPRTARYQGIVELTGRTLTDAVLHYFRQSEQLATALKLSLREVAGRWHAGGLLLQRLPEEESEQMRPGSAEKDDWRRALLLMATCQEEELSGPELPANDLLYRLFHEERVRVFRRRSVEVGCRCSRGRIARILRQLPEDEIRELKVDGEVVVTCQFCNSDYRFDEKGLSEIYAPAENSE